MRNILNLRLALYIIAGLAAVGGIGNVIEGDPRAITFVRFFS